MVSIYCIEDINHLKYVGSTKQKLNRRLSIHKYHKKRNDRYCSSSKLNLDKCKIYELETCNESNRKERERYWINKIDCVNHFKLNGRDMNHRKEWYKNNKEKKKEYNKKQKENRREYNLFRSRKVVNGCYEFIKMLEEY